ncbi:MAG: hypothetical protein V3T72_22330 [Thermoanaerobaculia bacterium]
MRFERGTLGLLAVTAIAAAIGYVVGFGASQENAAAAAGSRSGCR